MITGTYLGSAAHRGRSGAPVRGGTLRRRGRSTRSSSSTFFLASAGASAAYLTVSEIFPMETRALAIAFFYAVGTRHRRHHRAAAVRPPDRDAQPDVVMIAFLIGAGVMALGGIAELFLGVTPRARSSRTSRTADRRGG